MKEHFRYFAFICAIKSQINYLKIDVSKDLPDL